MILTVWNGDILLIVFQTTNDMKIVAITYSCRLVPLWASISNELSKVHMASYITDG